MTDKHKCFFCGGRVIHSGDHDLEGTGKYCDEFLFESNFVCSNCEAFYLVAHELVNHNG